jgi:LysM repeat protein
MSQMTVRTRRFFLSLLIPLLFACLVIACSNEETTANATPRPTGQATAAPTRVAPTIRPTRPVATNSPLRLPTAHPNLPTTYSVQTGDMWSSIAAKFGVTMDALLVANGRKATDTIHPGDVLFVPSADFHPAFIPYPGNGRGPTQCRDGTYSHSSGRGTCSHHGGIAR